MTGEVPTNPPHDLGTIINRALPHYDALDALERRGRLGLMVRELRKRHSSSVFHRMFPGDGVFRRSLYPKHLELFAAGRDYRERCFMAANRVGKTLAAAYEVTCHATGLYPAWWPGYRFRRPISAWCSGKTNETTRDIVQKELFGGVRYSDGGRRQLEGTGMVPGDLIRVDPGPSWRTGVADLADTVYVRHVPTSGWSRIGLKSYQQGRGSFEGTAQDFIWLDEECPQDIYGECLVRTGTTNGRILLTFTPLLGLTPVVLDFLPREER